MMCVLLSILFTSAFCQEVKVSVDSLGAASDAGIMSCVASPDESSAVSCLRAISVSSGGQSLPSVEDARSTLERVLSRGWFDAAEAVITQAAHLALENPRAAVQVTGSADPTGSRKSNTLLSELRAQRVVDHLLENGVTQGQIRQSGRGSVKFAISALESRRVEIFIPVK